MVPHIIIKPHFILSLSMLFILIFLILFYHHHRHHFFFFLLHPYFLLAFLYIFFPPLLTPYFPPSFYLLFSASYSILFLLPNFLSFLSQKNFLICTPSPSHTPSLPPFPFLPSSLPSFTLTSFHLLPYPSPHTLLILPSFPS